MKKLFIFFAAVILTAMSANVFAQGSGIAPQIGSTHDYWVNASESEGVLTQNAGIGNNYRWWVSETITDLTDAMTAGNEFTVISGTYDGTGDEDNFMIELIWNASSALKTYYLVVEETDVAGCVNMKAVAIKPVNSFNVIFAAVGGEGDDTDNPERCAPDIALSADAVTTTITYNYGSDEYLYKISSTGLFSTWNFDYDFTNTLGNATSDIGYSVDGITYSTEEPANGSKTVTPTSGTATVYFKVSVNNNTSEEGLDEQSMVLTLTNISDGENAPASIVNNNGDDISGDIKQTQIVKARPATTGISYN